MKVNKYCFNCQKGKVITINGDILCYEKGPVSPNFICSRHTLSEQAAVNRPELKCINCENFAVDIDNDDDECAVGLCQMFSVRKFDGNQKKACSKFVQKQKHKRGSIVKTACTI